MKKIKILYYTDARTSGGVVGGAEKYLELLLANINHHSFKTYLICAGDKSHIHWRNIIRATKTKVYPIVRRDIFYLANIKRVYKKIREIKPDIVHLQFWSPYACAVGLFAARLTRVPIIFGTEHSFVPLSDSNIFKIPFKAAYQIIRKKIVGYPTTVSYASRKMMYGGQLFSGKKIYVIHNGITLLSKSDFYSSNMFPRDLLPNDKINFLTVARLEQEKGHEVLVKAISRLPEEIFEKVQFHFVGGGSEEPTLKAMIKNSGLDKKITFWGERKDVRKIFPLFDIFVFPSMRENFPFVILEAMDAGLPIISSDVGGIKEALKDNQGGFLVPPGKPEILTRKITYLVENQDVVKTMSEFNKRLVSRSFSDKIMTSKTEELYLYAITANKERGG
jgi:glycosyltransferase involved in cell wall biosynthesis